MKAGVICNRQVSIAWKDEPLLEAARRMRDAHVGDVVVVEKQGNERIPTAILTDRDIVVGIVAQDARRLENLLVGDVVSDGLITAREEDDLGDVLTAMKYHGIRRLPVVNANGGLVGIIAFDDLIDFMAEQMSDLAKVVMKEQKVEHERRV